MSYKDALKEFRSCLNQKCLICSNSQYKEFINYGFLLKSEKTNKFYSFQSEEIKVEIITPEKFDLNLSNILNIGLCSAKQNDTNKMYIMTYNRLEKYKQLGMIIKEKENFYYRVFYNERWLVKII